MFREGRPWRRWRDRLFRLSAALCGLAACSLLVVLLAAIVRRALPVLRLDFLTRAAAEAGAAGGIAEELAGTALLLATALAVCLPVAVGTALHHAVYGNQLRNRRQAGRGRWTLIALYTANSVPSVLFGIAGFMVFSRFLGWGKSWLAGGVVLGVMILPTVTVALLERLAGLPRRYVEAAAALGLSRSQIVWHVLLPQSAGGLLSGVLLGLARAAGETAPILFTAAVFSGAGLFPAGVRDSPVAALPYHIFVLAQDSLAPSAHDRLWGAACVLFGLVLLLSLAALPARLALHEEARRG
jgi:phosphate transport system permease protein